VQQRRISIESKNDDTVSLPMVTSHNAILLASGDIRG